MTAQQLKNSILQLAVQGKLVPQDSSDEPASVLLQRIKAEKQELIKACKIKKDKKSSEIFRGASRNLPYTFCEQIGKEIRDISDEIPFEIPDSWEWVRLGSIVYNRGQMKPTSDFCYVDIGSIDNKRQRLGDTENIITPDKAPSRARKIIDVDDIIYSTVRPYLHNMCIIDRQFSLQPIASTGFATMTCYSGLLNKYLFYYLLAPDFDNYANDTENSKGVAYPAINDDRLYKALIPLPPLSEQHRIVAKIEELLPYIERYGKAEEHLTALSTTFPEALKKSILQEAVQGKLVPQNPDDEPASVLLERIRAEKQELIKQGKIKKNKNESVIITRDKIPYEIPDSWVWCTLGSIINLVSGQDFDSCDFNAEGKGIPYLTGASNIIDEKIILNRWTDKPRCIANCGDLLIVCKGAGVGKMCILAEKEVHIARQIMSVQSKIVDIRYIKIFLGHNLILLRKSMQGVIPGISRNIILSMLLPLPPLAEQKRIVEKIEELMTFCEKLK